MVCRLPVKSPWLNAIEPKWIHAKRAIVEPERKLTAQELKIRVCDYFECPLLEPLAKKSLETALAIVAVGILPVILLSRQIAEMRVRS